MKKILIWLLLFISFVVVAQAQEFDTETCLYCHANPEEEAPQISAEKYYNSIHQELDCMNCHEDISELPHKESLNPVNCLYCHEDATNYKRHGVYEVGKNNEIPSCSDCHGVHDILSPDNENSSVHPKNLPATCGNCHEDPEFTAQHKFSPKHPIETYLSSVHGKATKDGKFNAATCNDCHSSNGSAHQIYSPGHPESTINHFVIPNTCGKCHQETEKEYWEGIHGQLTARGGTDSPVCTNCHGEHQILPVSDERSPVSKTHLAEATCAPCHESAALSEKYGLPAGRLASFIDSYHGLKSKAGDTTVANCASCHGAHLILSHEDERSSIHSANLQKTCGDCHPNITQALATTKIHEEGGPHERGWPYLFTVIYSVLIAVTVTGMLLYIFLDLWRQIKNTMNKDQVQRMTRWAVAQHALLLVSFVTLVITGFALRFSDSWWAVILFGRTGGFPVRNMIHRIAAVVFILTSLMHLVYLRSGSGRDFLKSIFPRLEDLKHFVAMLKFNLGFSKERPQFRRFSYIEKFEYWALIWGSAIMAATGIMLWFDNFFVQYLPKGVLDVMLVIHYYEAWLATLSILIWHLYSTVFNPGVYPMNPSWLTGKMPKEQFEHEHPGEDI